MGTDLRTFAENEERVQQVTMATRKGVDCNSSPRTQEEVPPADPRGGGAMLGSCSNSLSVDLDLQVGFTNRPRDKMGFLEGGGGLEQPWRVVMVLSRAEGAIQQ